MKMKYVYSLMAVGVLCLTAVGCSEKSEKKEDFDAAAYTQAFLDAHIKGNTQEYTKLSGESAEELTGLFDEEIQSLVTLSLGENTNEPGNQVISPQLSQDYSSMWKKVLENTKYKAVDAKKEGDSYAVTVETQCMDLNIPVNDLLTEKLTDYYSEVTDTEVNATEIYLQLMLESYQEVLDDISYADPTQTTVTLSQNDQKLWTMSKEDLQTVKDSLFLPAVSSAGNATEDGSSSDAAALSTEATPDQTYPDDLEQTPSHSLGETFIIQQVGKDMVEFSIDKVEVTDERSEYDPSNPEKVVVVTYTYKNLGYEDPILYDQMSFKLLEGESTCTPYYLQNLAPADIAVKGGEAITASLAYGVSADCKEVTVYVNNSQIQNPFQVTVPLA